MVSAETNPRHGRSGVAKDPRHWAYVGNGDYVSIAAPEPTTWEREIVNGALVYISGDYTIKRYIGPSGNRSYTVWREDEELTLAFYGRLADAKIRAIRNARGEDKVHVA